MIYAMHAVGLNMVKFGRAKDPDARLDVLKTGCPAPLELVGYLDCGDEVERLIHECFRYSRKHGEWFIEDDNVLSFVQVMGCPNSTEEQKVACAMEMLRERQPLGIAYG